MDKRRPREQIQHLLRDAVRYGPADRSPQAPLVKAIQRLARKYPRWDTVSSTSFWCGRAGR
jgi:hypothetical protein